MDRRAKIIATIGPATGSKEKITALIQAGMNFARFNMSHGSHDDHRKVVSKIREYTDRTGTPVGILLDLQGPKIRTGTVEGNPVLEQGSKVKISSNPGPSTSSSIHINYSSLGSDIKPGSTILLDDGRLELKVTDVDGETMLAEVISGGKLGANKGVNFPGIKLSISGLTDKDIRDLAFGSETGIDAIALSFVRTGNDLIELREEVEKREFSCDYLPIIAKLERPEAVENLDEILTHADGVMVARGDLGVEVSPERVPSLQKKIIRRAREKHRFVITATQMLDSMMDDPRPTRAEASDVANAVFDGSDALMLSGETAVGQYPIKSVETMSRIILDAEIHAGDWGIPQRNINHQGARGAVATTYAAKQLADDCEATAIAVFTRSGRTARLMANARPLEPILAFTPEENAFRQMTLLWGVEPHLIPMASTVEEMINHVENALRSSGTIPEGGKVVIVASLPIGAMGPANFTLLHTIR
jgi:pyruvate kinase